MTTSQLSTDVHKYHERFRSALQLDNLEEIERILCELETVCRTTTSDDPNDAIDRKLTTDKDELKFWLIDVARLMLETKCASTRRLALNALESVIPHLLKTNYQDLPVWVELRSIISRDYTSLLDIARSDNDPNWHRMWSALVQVMDRDLCQGSMIINMFLSIVEAGFRSAEISMREQSFDCWSLLVRVFASNKQINLPKRLKLICIPLKSSKSKTETIALRKFDIWWFILNHLRPQLDELADTIFEPFIYFCFGPSFKPPLSYYFDETYQEFGTPGKIYQAIKQLSAIALIHLLGPAPEVTKTLLVSADAVDGRLPFDFPTKEIAISPLLFSTKAKLLIDACIECTVLFAQMKHLNYLGLNRCLWDNLMERINNEKTVRKNELLQRIKEDTNALLNLCIKQNSNASLRELFYDTLLIIAKSDLLTVTIGYDSPEQAIINYRSFMSNILHPELPCPVNKSDEIIKHVFALQRYTRQKGYWEMLQKTIQYLCATDGGYCLPEFRTIRTQIYCHLASYLIIQIRDDRVGFLKHQSTVMSFLLYPLEYDQLLMVENVKNLWDEVYTPIASLEKKSCEFANSFCEMIKAMTVAKFAFNLGVVADFFCTILSSLSVEFDSSRPPLKVFELFKDLTRKAQAYHANLYRVEKMISCFRELLAKMSMANTLTLIMPIRNAFNEMVSNDKGLTMEEVQRSLGILASKIVTTCMLNELAHQPKEVLWNCKMLLKMMLDLPADVKKGWKQGDMRKCLDICDGREANTPNTCKKEDDEFVVIESVWKFKPEVLTEHQREKMMQKRTDIPALYNDMSQSQDSFVIKPWTPNKRHESMNTERLGTETVSSTAKTTTEKAEAISEKTDGKVGHDGETVGSTSDGDETRTKLTRPDKENKHGNVFIDQSASLAVKEGLDELEEDEIEQTTETTKQSKQNDPKRSKKRSILEQLRIDTVEGKTLDVMNLSRTRRSEVPDTRPTRRKSLPIRKVESETKYRPGAKVEGKSVSVSKITTKKDHRKEARNTRKLLNFKNIENNSLVMGEPEANASDDVIESSQTPIAAQSFVGRKVSLRKSRVEESVLNPVQRDEVIVPMQVDKTVQIAKEDETSQEVLSFKHIVTNRATDEITVENLESGELAALKNTSAELKHVAVRIPPEQTTRSSIDGRVETSKDAKTLEKELCSKEVLSVERIETDRVVDQTTVGKLEAGENVAPKNTSVELKRVTATIPPQRTTRSSIDGRVETSRDAETSEKVTRSQTSSHRSFTHHGTENSITSLSPSKRSTRLSTNDNACGVNNPLENRCSNTEDISKEKILLKSPRKSELEDKGTPSKKKTVNYDSPVRTALQLLNSPKRNLSGKMEQKRTGEMGLGSPKIARFSPLVVLEPMKDYPAVDKRDSELKCNSDPTNSLMETKPTEQMLSCDSTKCSNTIEDNASSMIHRSCGIDAAIGVIVEDAEEKRAASSTVSENASSEINSVDQFSPVKNLDDEMEPLNRSLNRSIVSSPDLADAEERNAKLLDSTLNISPISEEQGAVNPSDNSVLAGSIDRGSSNRTTVLNMSTMSRRNKPSPSSQVQAAGPSNSGGLQQQKPSSSTSVVGTPRSSSTSMLGLGGRGAQLINLIRSQHTDQSPKANIAPQNASTPKGCLSVGSANHLMMRKRATSASVASATPDANFPPGATNEREDNPDKPQYLIFSKVLPSPLASPASSILKRRIHPDDTGNDVESPPSKRKRVSFHDPPVSLMKEYIRQEGECRSPSKSRSLQLATSMSSADKAKYMMRRSITSSNISELQNFAKNHHSEEISRKMPSDTHGTAGTVRETEGDEEELTSSPESLDDNQFMIHDATDNRTTLQVTAELMHVNENPIDSALGLVQSVDLGEPSAVCFESEETVLKHVMARYTLDDVVEQYLSAGRTLEHGKSARLLTKELSSVMLKDAKIRHQVLDELSERHPVEFLDHAIQENSSSMVCERLSLVAMIDHIFKHLNKGYDPARKTDMPTTLVDKDNDSLQLIQCIYEKLFNLPNIESNGQTLTVLRDRFLREELAHLSRLEIMALLESYFKSTGEA